MDFLLICFIAAVKRGLTPLLGSSKAWTYSSYVSLRAGLSLSLSLSLSHTHTHTHTHTRTQTHIHTHTHTHTLTQIRFYHMIGNAVVPPVIEAIAKQMLAAGLLD